MFDTNGSPELFKSLISIYSGCFKRGIAYFPLI